MIAEKTEVLTIQGHYGPAYKIIDPGEGVIGAALHTGQPYEAKLLNHIYRREFSGTAVDVGAHIGNHTLWFALACGLKVCAFEPLEFGSLMANLNLNPSADVQPWPVALGERCTRARALGKGQLAYDPVEGEVPVSPLDDFRLNDICLIKIDVEGMEPQVLRGAEQTIRRCRPVIYAEAQDRDAATRNAARLKEYGYALAGTFGATPMEEWLPC